MSKGEYLGELEMLVLYALIRFGLRAYGMAIRQEIHERSGRDVSIGSVYKTLQRLEEKQYVASYRGEATPERGGKAKRYFVITASGRSALAASEYIFAQMRRGLRVLPADS